MDIRSLVLRVEAYVQQRLPQYIEELRTLCAIDSYSYHKPGLDALAVWLAERLQRMGVKATVIERDQWGNDLYGVLKGDGRGKTACRSRQKEGGDRPVQRTEACIGTRRKTR